MTTEEDELRRHVALRWWTRLDAGEPTRQEREAFAAWLAESPLNKEVFDQISQLWDDFEPLRAHFDKAGPVPRRARRRLPIAAAVAAMLAILSLRGEDLALMLRGAELTGVAETRFLTLTDGSRVQMGAASAISVDFGAHQRLVTLLKGEAFFIVAPDATRPFSVAAGGGVVTALGTAFDVATESGRTQVTVVEHRVRMSGGGSSVVVDAGRQSAYGPGVAVAPPYPVDVEQVTAWRRGKLIFEDRPLSEVMAALGKYHHGVFFVIGDATRKRRVTGVFDAGDPIGAIRAIERSLGVSAFFLTDYLIVLRD
jgi:transmembrane sensor